MELDRVKTIVLAAQAELHSRFGVTTVLVFGSVARGEERPDSDVDLLVEFDRPTTLLGVYRLQSYFEELLGRRVEVGTVNGLRPQMRDRVLGEAVRVA